MTILKTFGYAKSQIFAQKFDSMTEIKILKHWRVYEPKRVEALISKGTRVSGSLFAKTRRQPYAETKEHAHGRHEQRRAIVVEAPDLAARHGFPGLCAIGCIASHRTTDGRKEKALRFYALSRFLPPAALLRVARAHWDIENGQHWALDVILDEYLARNRKDHGARNLALLRRFALNILRADPSKLSLRSKSKQASWGDCSFLFNLLSHMR